MSQNHQVDVNDADIVSENVSIKMNYFRKSYEEWNFLFSTY